MSTGAWVFVCGPSGAGKDSVIAATREILSAQTNIVFSRRMVTRPAQAGSDHDQVTVQEFRSLREAGRLSWHWEAHGFCYGIAGHYASDVQAGRVVVVNGSRAHADLLSMSPAVHVVQMTAAPDQLEERLTQRGRDNYGAITERLARNARFSAMKADCVIVNDGELTHAARCLADYLSGLPGLS